MFIANGFFTTPSHPPYIKASKNYWMLDTQQLARANRKGFHFFSFLMLQEQKGPGYFRWGLAFSCFSLSWLAACFYSAELRYYNCQSFVCIKAFIWKAQSKSPISHETVLIYVLRPSPDLINLCMALNLCFLHTRSRKLCKKGSCNCYPLFNNCLKSSLMQGWRNWNETEQGVFPYALNCQGGFIQN